MIMKKIVTYLIILLFPLVVYAQKPSYIIDSSDLVEISVWGEEGLSRQVTVRTDGYVSLPLVGDILASGKSPSVLQHDIEKSLSKYIKDPRCAVIILEPRSKRIYVEGQINAPGQFILDRDLFITQVISLAGGFSEWADKGSIVILRYEDKKRLRQIVNYKRIVKGKDQDVLLKPGDTIIVP